MCCGGKIKRQIIVTNILCDSSLVSLEADLPAQILLIEQVKATSLLLFSFSLLSLCFYPDVFLFLFNMILSIFLLVHFVLFLFNLFSVSPELIWTLIMKLPHTEVKVYFKVKSQTGLSLRVSCKRALVNVQSLSDKNKSCRSPCSFPTPKFFSWCADARGLRSWKQGPAKPKHDWRFKE